MSDSDERREADELERQGYRVHFHVWTPDEFVESIERFAVEEEVPIEVLAVGRNFREFVVVLEKRNDPVSSPADEDTPVAA